MTREEAIAHGKEQLEVFGGEHAEFIKLAIKALEKEPCTVDAKPIVYAHWNVIDQDREGDEGFVHVWETLCCSRCGMERTTEDGYIPQYCESCGAKMDE